MNVIYVQFHRIDDYYQRGKILLIRKLIQFICSVSVLSFLLSVTVCLIVEFH